MIDRGILVSMENNTTTETKFMACLLWAGVQTGVSVEEKSFATATEAKRYVQALRRRGRTAWVKGDKRYAKMEIA